MQWWWHRARSRLRLPPLPDHAAILLSPPFWWNQERSATCSHPVSCFHLPVAMHELKLATWTSWAVSLHPWNILVYIHLPFSKSKKHDAKLWTGTFKNQCCHRKNCKAKVCTLVQPGRQLICCVVFNFSALHLTFSESLEVLLLLLQPQLTTLRHTNAFRLCIEQNNPVPSREAGGTQVCTYICTPKSGADSVSLNKQYTFISLKIGLLSSFYPTATTNCTVKITLCGSE